MKLRLWKWEIIVVAAAVGYFLLDTKLGAGFVVGVTFGLMLSSGMEKRIKEQHAERNTP